jgi:hypothetical protein
LQCNTPPPFHMHPVSCHTPQAIDLIMLINNFMWT